MILNNTNTNTSNELNNETNKDSIIIIKQMYYDEYEKVYGDGFYPQMQPFGNICSCKKTIISFKLINHLYNGDLTWVQIDNSVIYGFDGASGIQLLYSLNKESKIYAKKILNLGGRIIYPKIPELSTYRVLSQNMNY